MAAKNRNRIQISPHFWLHEFEMKEGTVMIHPSVPVSLEATRADLCERYGEEVEVLITGSTRSEAYNEILGEAQGWIDNGGTVSRVSRHLPQYGGIAVDCKARIKRTKKPVPQKVLGEIARRHFDYVKDDYADGHVHADNRNEKP
jgi:hypothetical protein